MAEHTPKTPDGNSAAGSGSSRRAQEPSDAQLDTVRADLAHARSAGAAYKRHRDAALAENAQWQAEIANLRALIAGKADAETIVVGAIRRALRDGPTAGTDVASGEPPACGNPDCLDKAGYPFTAGELRKAVEAQILEALSVLGWPDDRYALTEAGHYWATAAQIVAGAAASKPDDPAARSLAGELWRLASGLADRGIELLPDRPIDTAAVDTALNEIDAPSTDPARRAQAVHDALVDAKPGDVFDFEQRPGQRVLVVVARSYAVEPPKTAATWQPARPGDTPGQLVPGEADTPAPITASSISSYPQDRTGDGVPEVEQDETCGDCMSGKCHGGEDGDCGCARHDASVEAGR